MTNSSLLNKSDVFYSLTQHFNSLIISSNHFGNFKKYPLVNNITVLEINSAEPKLFRKKIGLKGLGYKVFLENNCLIFKLNFSHPVSFEVPSYITNVIINKKSLVFESYDYIFLGNFIEKIYNLRPKDNYKGKGFNLKSKVVPIKVVKKK